MVSCRDTEWRSLKIKVRTENAHSMEELDPDKQIISKTNMQMIGYSGDNVLPYFNPIHIRTILAL